MLQHDPFHPRTIGPGTQSLPPTQSVWIGITSTQWALIRWLTIHQVIQPHLVPASTAVPTAATKQQNEKHNDEKCGGIHVRFPRNAACRAAWNSGHLTTFGRPSGSRYSRG